MFPAIQLGKLTTAPVSPERAAGDESTKKPVVRP